ncbi:hypothetical protein SynBIOSU31_01595 [Synechococcus sp. BIOS-U3-1]|mgnify:CR=1|nr:hypothetical protein SynBIOSU31_01595 [Synechococcus sp. BIOS-U3-1]
MSNCSLVSGVSFKDQDRNRYFNCVGQVDALLSGTDTISLQDHSITEQPTALA